MPYGRFKTVGTVPLPKIYTGSEGKKNSREQEKMEDISGVFNKNDKMTNMTLY